MPQKHRSFPNVLLSTNSQNDIPLVLYRGSPNGTQLIFILVATYDHTYPERRRFYQLRAHKFSTMRTPRCRRLLFHKHYYELPIVNVHSCKRNKCRYYFLSSVAITICSLKADFLQRRRKKVKRNCKRIHIYLGLN